MNQMEALTASGCEGQWEEMGFALSGSGVIYAGAAVFAAATPMGWVMLGAAAASFAVAYAGCSD